MNNYDPIPLITWDVETEGAFGDMSRSSPDAFASTVDDIAAFATSNLATVDGSASPFDPTPLPFHPVEPVHRSGDSYQSGELRRGYSLTSSSILDQDDIAFFKNLFHTDPISQDIDTVGSLFLENEKELPSQAPEPHAKQQLTPTLMISNQHQAAPINVINNIPPPHQQGPALTSVTPIVALHEPVVPTTGTATVSAYNFPRKLFRLLEDCDTNPEYKSICSWLPDGKQFKIHNKKRFVEVILRNYFDQTQYSSFRRQLNMYSFVRQSVSTYANPHFIRGQPALLNRVVRKNGSNSKSKKG
jgi:hypothetical protein